MHKMQEEYDHLLNLDYESPYQIPLTTSDEMLFTAGRSCEKLDGQWNFSVDVFDTFLRKKFFAEEHLDEQGRERPIDCDFDGWEKVMLPSNWNLAQERYYYYEGTGVYTRTFHFLPNQEDERVFLRIGAANYACRVWLNGALISRHEGGFTPFFTELTPYLKEHNRIILLVNNTRKLEQVPSINYDWFNYGGVPRSISLYRLPPLFIKDFFVSLLPNGKFDTIQAQITLSGAVQGVACQVCIPELGITKQCQTDANGVATIAFAASPVLWSCDAPKLYEVQVSCLGDSVTDRVGFREIKVVGKEILLNNKPIFLKGVCCHEESTKSGRALGDEERLQILQTAKELGCNIMRLSHYPHSERMAQLADEIGMMLWEEIPVYWALCFENPETYASATNQMRELILRDRNRASVVIWSVGNENPDTDSRLTFMSGLAQICREMDHTRPVSAACLVDIDEMRVKDRMTAHVDIVAFNEYYGWYYRDYSGLQQILENTHLEQPMVISETGAGSLPGHFGGEEELFTEEHQAKMYAQQFAYSDGFLQGIFPWVLYDFRSPVRMNPIQNQHNRKGLVAFDKKQRKLAFQTVQRYYDTK